MDNPFNPHRDAMNMADPKEVANSAMTVVDRLQDFNPAVQAMGAAAAFLSLAEHLKIPAQDLFTSTKNLINGVDGKRVEFRAIDAYMEGEL